MDANDYRLPGSNRITFSNQLADEIRERFAADRDNRFQLFLLAAGLRKKYLNKKTKEYDKGFLDWLKAEQLEVRWRTSQNMLLLVMLLIMSQVNPVTQ